MNEREDVKEDQAPESLETVRRSADLKRRIGIHGTLGISIVDLGVSGLKKPEMAVEDPSGENIWDGVHHHGE